MSSKMGRCCEPATRAVSKFSRVMSIIFDRSSVDSANFTRRGRPAPKIRGFKRQGRAVSDTTGVKVGVVMGSSSDWDVMRHAADILTEFGVPFEAKVVSAHRMPDDMFRYAEEAAQRGLVAIIAGAGGAAHLPGMLAAKTTVPVLGVP